MHTASRSWSAGPTSPPVRIFTRTADFQVLGEAEDVIDDFVAAWERRRARRRVQGGEVQDRRHASSPIPRFDLLKLDHYLYIGVQFRAAARSPASSATSSSSTAACRAPRPTPQMLAELRHALSARLPRPCRLRRRQPDRQQEGAEVVSARAAASGSKRTTIRSNSPPRHRSISPTTTNCWS